MDINHFIKVKLEEGFSEEEILQIPFLNKRYSVEEIQKTIEELNVNNKPKGLDKFPEKLSEEEETRPVSARIPLSLYNKIKENPTSKIRYALEKVYTNIHSS